MGFCLTLQKRCSKRTQCIFWGDGWVSHYPLQILYLSSQLFSYNKWTRKRLVLCRWPFLCVPLSAQCFVVVTSVSMCSWQVPVLHLSQWHKDIFPDSLECSTDSCLSKWHVALVISRNMAVLYRSLCSPPSWYFPTLYFNIWGECRCSNYQHAAPYSIYLNATSTRAHPL